MLSNQTNIKRFNVAISRINYTSKADVKNNINAIIFDKVNISSREFLNFVKSGFAFCNIFTDKKSFKIYEKSNENFVATNFIAVDIDETDLTVNEFINALTIQPTFYYTTYSNTEDAARFRLIYIFEDEITNIFEYRYMTTKINNIISRDTRQIVDFCNLNVAQYFNGSNSKLENFKSGFSDIIYKLSDIGYDKSDFLNFLLTGAGYKTMTDELNYRITDYFNEKLCEGAEYRFNINNNNTKVKKDDISKLSKTILNDFDRLSPEEFIKTRDWNIARNKTKYVYRRESDKWINDLYQCVDFEYFSLFWNYETQKDGQKRRRNLYQRMCLRRVLKNEISKDEMIVNTIIDIIKFYDNSDKVLNSDFIIKNVNACFEISISDIEKQFAKTINYLQKSTKPKRGIIYKNKKAHTRETTYLILDEMYDDNLSVADNLYNINELYDFKVSERTLYNYLKFRGKKTSRNKLSDDELILLLDKSKSVRENYQFIKDNDIKCSKDRICKLLKQK